MTKERERVHDERVTEQVHELAPVADAVGPPEVHRVLECAVDRLGLTEEAIAPSRPAGVNAVTLRAPRSIQLPWNASTPGVFGVVRYNIYRTRVNPGWWWVGFSTSDPSYNDLSVEHRKTYRYFTEACDDRSNCSRWSDPVDVTAL